MPTTSTTLLTQITQTFSSSECEDFLLPLHHENAFEFILEAITQEHQTCSPDQLTLLMDPQTAQQNNFLNTLPKASNIHLSESLPESTLAYNIIQGLELSEGQQFLILLSPYTSLLLIQSPKENNPSDNTIFGYWSFHTKTITLIAQHILDTTPLNIPTMATDQNSCFVSSLTMNLMKQENNFIAQRQHTAIAQKNEMSLILDILKSLSVRRSTHELLYVFVEKIAESIQAARCSVIRIWDDSTEAHVLASHEDSSIDDMIIQLEKYPEILHALDTASTTAINDLENDPITRSVAPQLIQMGLSAIVVIPIVMENPKVGTFLLRIVRKGGTFAQHEIDFCRIAAETASNAIERSDLFDTIQQSNRTLERLATTDSLTNLHNRRYFMERMEDEIKRTQRYGTTFSCALIDIDNFKAINDTHGHLQGDEVLKEVARRTLMSVRTNDVVARYGGEEFIILLPQTDLEGSKTHAKRLLNNIPAKPYKGLPVDLPITVSIGLASTSNHENLTADALIKIADDALYEAKRTGKNKLVIAD